MADLRDRLAAVQWTRGKAVAAFLLLFRLGLNMYSTAANVINLPARDESYVPVVA